MSPAKGPAPADMLAESPAPIWSCARRAHAGHLHRSDPWVEVNKQFGVFDFRRVGIGYADNILLFSLDASVAVGPLAFSMDALTVGSPLTAFASDLQPRTGCRSPSTDRRSSWAGHSSGSPRSRTARRSTPTTARCWSASPVPPDRGRWLGAERATRVVLHLSGDRRADRRTTVPAGHRDRPPASGSTPGWCCPVIDKVGSYPLLPGRRRRRSRAIRRATERRCCLH